MKLKRNMQVHFYVQATVNFNMSLRVWEYTAGTYPRPGIACATLCNRVFLSSLLVYSHESQHSLPTRLARDESRSLASSFPPWWMATWGGGGGGAVCVGTVGFNRSPRASKPEEEIKVNKRVRWVCRKTAFLIGMAANNGIQAGRKTEQKARSSTSYLI